MPKFVVLWTDFAIWGLLFAAVAYGFSLRNKPNLAASWRKVFRDTPALCSAMVLVAAFLITLADSIHYRPLISSGPGSDAKQVVDSKVLSALDALTKPWIDGRERTYSRPMATHAFTKETEDVNGVLVRQQPRLSFGGAHLANVEDEYWADVTWRVVKGLITGIVLSTVLCGLIAFFQGRISGEGFGNRIGNIVRGNTEIPWLAAFVTIGILSIILCTCIQLGSGYHILGTDVTGNDVLYQALKSLRTAFVIGTLATVATLPLAVTLGIMAGYFKGWVDELIQYLYTVLSSIPNILLIAACVLMVQVFLDKHPELFETGLERADLKLFLLCTVLGLTGWAGLCRLLRGETMKIRELEYVQAASAFGVSHWHIMARHVFPNVAHLMLIVTVIEFSTLILYEAVLSFVGVGVDPSMNSFGGMINFARSEMSRDPVVWWPFAAAFFFMVALVLAANLFADGVNAAFDPRARPKVRLGKSSGGTAENSAQSSLASTK